MRSRLLDHPALGPTDERLVRFTFNGRIIEARHGDSIAAALLAIGIRVLRHSQRGEARGLYCGVGHCYECRVVVNGMSGSRACLVLVCEGMRVEAD
jgi:sarcosine oxidase subunit alpha